MRSENEMLRLIVDTPRCDDRIRAVILNGSRANPNARRDIFQDFDLVYLVTGDAPFREDHTWIKRFGETMIVQMPEAMEDPPPDNAGSFAYLMQFADGNRIDLGLFPVARLSELERDSLSFLLLDKDGIIEPFAPCRSGRSGLHGRLTHSRRAAGASRSTWPCAPKVMRYLERTICAIGRIEPGRISSYPELSKSLPASGEVLPVDGTYLDSAASRRLYDTSIRALADYVGEGFPMPAPLPADIDAAWAKRLTARLGGRAPAKLWLAALLLERIALFEGSFKTFHFTRNINQG